MGKNGSKFTEINMCFLLAKHYWDTNTWNFYCAISIYLRNLISYLPSKNTILSEEVLEKYSQTQSLIEEYIEKITNLVNQDNQIQLIIEYFKELSNPEIDTTSLECKCDIELSMFIEENSIEFNIVIEETEAIKLLKKEIKDTFAELKGNFGFQKGLSLDKYRAIIKSVSDKIFYTNGYSNNNISFENLRTLDAINECGKNISEKSTFLDYSNKFQDNVKLPILISNYLTDFNQFFEESFNENNFNILFPFNGYKETFGKLLSVKFPKINNKDKNIILENCEIIVKIVPFLKICNEFKKCLKSMVYTQDGSIRIRFDFNPFIAAIWQIRYKIKQDTRKMGLSNRFVSLYWTEETNYSNFFKLEHRNGVVQASNWYKLSYHYTRKEETVFLWSNTEFRWTLIDNVKENPFYLKEEYLRFINEVYIDCNKEEDKFYQARYENKMVIEDASEFTELPNKYQSLFNHYIFTDGGNYRKHIHSSFSTYHSSAKVYKTDFWTQGICYELWKITFQDCTWRNLLELPEACKDITLY